MTAIDQPATDLRVSPQAIFAASGNAIGIANFVNAISASMKQYLATQNEQLLGPTFSGLSSTIFDVQYPEEHKTGEVPIGLGEVEYVNDTSVEQSVTWVDARTTSVEATVSVTEGIEAGAGANFGIPEIGLGVSINVKASVSTTQTQRTSTTQAWTWTVPIVVPARSRVSARAFLKRVQYDLGFTAKVRIDGSPESCLALGNRFPFRLFANSPGGWFTLAPVDGFTPEGTAVLYQVRGVMRNVQGTGVEVRVQESPLDAAEGAAAARDYTVDNAHALPRQIIVPAAE